MIFSFSISAAAPVLFAEDAASTEDAENDDPVPYEEEEFPSWVTGLRRAEIILFGSYPITLLAAQLVYGLVRFGINGFAVEYAPQPFAGGSAVAYTQDEIIGMALSAAGVSLVIAFVDNIVFKKQMEKKALKNKSP